MSQDGAKKTLEAHVFGRVQGVGFRYYAHSKARSLGLSGWVRNEADGTVSVVCEGDEPSVKEMASWLEQGPPSAHVQRVDKRFKEYKGLYRTFTVE